ncbi:twin-arginine translocation signal domain-containing protein [Oxynema aestuarii]|uniref:Twin-arginine translocation signal domain-containing protein n=1 Tax=Oxynema aestuarii AP17 TaxID=2064643 RepID=A0A6H1TVK9_9CYAN|nr:twin-arginine translocation signal domain-containing protein [Oxynema aestuarii AP17]RMH76226.1 MAG: twin-arginine translocation signal domain-containing protein [Cyanobacteria bacterium J007]
MFSRRQFLQGSFGTMGAIAPALSPVPFATLDNF